MAKQMGTKTKKKFSSGVQQSAFAMPGMASGVGAGASLMNASYTARRRRGLEKENQSTLYNTGASDHDINKQTGRMKKLRR